MFRESMALLPKSRYTSGGKEMRLCLWPRPFGMLRACRIIMTYTETSNTAYHRAILNIVTVSVTFRNESDERLLIK